MSRVNKFASQPISDALIDELADLLYEAAIRSCTPRQDIRRIVGDFLEDYRDADQVLCSVCKETKTDYIRQQWQMMLMDNINDRRRRIILAAHVMKRSDECSVCVKRQT